MKHKSKILLTAGLSAALVLNSCSDKFLDRPPLGAISEVSLNNATGVNGSLIQTYRTLRGANVGAWYTSPMNWVWGSVRAEEAYKGTEPADQNQLNPIERYETLPNNGSVLAKWNACYDGIAQANQTLRLLAAATDITEADRTRIEAETKFLRGFHHFEAKRNFNKVPFVDETKLTNADLRALKNDADIYPQIEADLKFAYDNLPETQAQIGRVNKWAAGAFLAKAMLYQKKYTEAKVIFDAIIGADPANAVGKTSRGDRYGRCQQQLGERVAEPAQRRTRRLLRVFPAFADAGQFVQGGRSRPTAGQPARRAGAATRECAE